MPFKVNRGAPLVAASLVLGSLYYVQVHDERNRADCQAELNSIFVENIRIRADLAAEADNLTSGLLLGLGEFTLPVNPTPAQVARSVEGYTRLYTEYAQKTEANRMARLARPIPDLRDRCK